MLDERTALLDDERIVLLDDERTALLDDDERLGVATRCVAVLVRLGVTLVVDLRTFVLP